MCVSTRKLIKMASFHRALLLMGILLFATFLFLSSHTIDAAEEQKTDAGDAFRDGAAAGSAVADDKQADAVCRGRCCKYVKHRNSLRCIRCCADGEEAPANDAESIVDNKQVCRCCNFVLVRGMLRCFRSCCPPSADEGPVKAEVTKEHKN